MLGAFEPIIPIFSIACVAAAIGALFLRDFRQRRKAKSVLNLLGLKRMGRESADSVLSLPILAAPGEKSPEIRDLAKGEIDGLPLTVFLYWNDPTTPALGLLGWLTIAEAARTRSSPRRCVLVHLPGPHRLATSSERVRIKGNRIVGREGLPPDYGDLLADWAKTSASCEVRVAGDWLLVESKDRDPRAIPDLAKASVDLARRMVAGQEPSGDRDR